MSSLMMPPGLPPGLLGPGGPGPGGPPPGPPGGDAGRQSGIAYLREAIRLLQQAADASDVDDIETADVSKFIAGIQGIIAGRQKMTDAAFGGGPATQILRRGA